MKTIETWRNGNDKAEIFVDEDADSPRKNRNDNLCYMVCAHRRYRLGDEQRREGESEEELLERVPRIIAALPLYLYDHSGITMSTTAFSCPWDSGQVGWAYITQERADEMGCLGWSAKQLEEAIRAEVGDYDMYLRGDVYGYVVTRDGEIGDFYCGGFLGIEAAREEARVEIGLPSSR